MSERNTYRVLIVDDEQPARQRLRELMDNDPDVGDMMEAENGLDAVEAILQKQPDVVFLDVQMPGLDGLGVIDTIGIERMTRPMNSGGTAPPASRRARAIDSASVRTIGFSEKIG